MDKIWYSSGLTVIHTKWKFYQTHVIVVGWTTQLLDTPSSPTEAISLQSELEVYIAQIQNGNTEPARYRPPGTMKKSLVSKATSIANKSMIILVDLVDRGDSIAPGSRSFRCGPIPAFSISRSPHADGEAWKETGVFKIHSMKRSNPDNPLPCA